MNGREEARVLEKARRRERWLGRPRHRWVKIREVGWGDVDWIGVAEDRNKWRAVVNSVLNLRVP
jgi:hypothetical protein